MKILTRKIKNFHKLGILNSIGVLIEKRKIWSLTDANLELGEKTSISDANNYLRAVSAASSNDEVFKKFRRCLEYRQILEHITYLQSFQYKKILKKRKYTFRKMNSLRTLDELGSPIRFYFPISELHSPTSYRYLKVLSDLEILFDGDSSLKNIAEIGGGFGGQMMLVAENFTPSTITIYDLPEVLQLQKKFLKEKIKDTQIIFADGRNPKAGSFDLVISNYALSEISRNIQDEYFDKVLASSKCGYLTWNVLSEKELGGYSVDEVISKIPGSRIIEEKPLTAEGNVIIVWGDNGGRI